MTTPGPAGWYDDPQDPKAERYWDGQDWTGRLKPKSTRRQAPPPIPTPGPSLPEPAPWTPPRTAGSTAVMIKAIGAVALVVIGGFFTYKLFSGGSHGHQVSVADRVSGTADEDQIKQLVATWTDDLNKHDLQGLTSLMCAGSASQLPRNVFYTVDKIGPLTTSVGGIKVKGNQATATVISNWSNGSHEAWENSYGKENGSWKICHTVNF
jgi:Protein of unknown function (DUF2510)